MIIIYSNFLTSWVNLRSLAQTLANSMIALSATIVIDSNSSVLSFLRNSTLWLFIILPNILFSLIWLEFVFSFVIHLCCLLISWYHRGISISIVALPSRWSLTILRWLLVSSSLLIDCRHHLTLFYWGYFDWTSSQWTFHSIHSVVCAYSFSRFRGSFSRIISHSSLEYLLCLIFIGFWLEIWFKSTISHIKCATWECIELLWKAFNRNIIISIKILCILWIHSVSIENLLYTLQRIINSSTILFIVWSLKIWLSIEIIELLISETCCTLHWG